MNKEKFYKSFVMSVWAPRLAVFAFLSLLFTVFASTAAYAVDVEEANDVMRNMTNSVERLPAMISAMSYLVALLFGVLGILNIKQHVELGGGPNGVALRKPIMQLLAGGALLALPTVYEAMYTTIDGGENKVGIDFEGTPLETISNVIGALAGFVPLQDVNSIMENMIDSIERAPALISAVAYLFGLLLGVLGILKIKNHVENPDQVPLKDGVIRLIIGGALFAIPSIYQAMYTTIIDDGLAGASVARQALAIAGFISTPVTGLANPATCTLGIGAGANLGDVLCASIIHTALAPAFLTAVSYVIGLVLGLWALVKLRDHVENPGQTKLSEGISRLIAGGMFFALPIMIEVARSTATPGALIPFATAGFTGDGNAPGLVGGLLGLIGLGGGAGGGAVGLSASLQNFMNVLLGPAAILLNWFGHIAGTVLIMIAIMRLIKSSQEGARGPGGIGTIMTFITGGALISFNTLMTAFSTSFFNNPLTASRAALQYTDGMSADEVLHAHIVISAILKFMIILGLISFIRGIFIIRDVAEGKQQASVMAGVTHMIGGSLAVNLGPLLNAVQATLGITGFGVLFNVI